IARVKMLFRPHLALLKRHSVTMPMKWAQLAIFEALPKVAVTDRKMASCPTAMRVVTEQRVEGPKIAAKVILTSTEGSRRRPTLTAPAAHRRELPALTATLMTNTECLSEGSRMAGPNGGTQYVGTCAAAALVTDSPRPSPSARPRGRRPRRIRGMRVQV